MGGDCPTFCTADLGYFDLRAEHGAIGCVADEPVHVADDELVDGDLLTLLSISRRFT